MAAQNTSDRDRIVAFFKNALTLCGVALILTRSFLALFFAYLAYQLFMNPEDLEIIQYIEGVFLSGYNRSYLVYGEMNGRPVAIKMSEQGKTFGAMLLIVLGLGIFSLTARVLIEGGSSILRVFTSPFLHEYGKKLKAAKQQPQGNSKQRPQQGQRQSQPRSYRCNQICHARPLISRLILCGMIQNQSIQAGSQSPVLPVIAFTRHKKTSVRRFYFSEMRSSLSLLSFLQKML